MPNKSDTPGRRARTAPHGCPQGQAARLEPAVFTPRARRQADRCPSVLGLGSPGASHVGCVSAPPKSDHLYTAVRMLLCSVRCLTIAFVSLLSLLFSQLATASYVCPKHADMASMAAMMASGQPCHGMDKQQPALCHEHAADPAKTFEAVKLPALSQPALVQVLELPLVLD